MNAPYAWLPIVVVVLGFAARVHPARVILGAALTAAVVGGLSGSAFLEVLGASFLKARYLLVIALALPVIAQMEAHGLRALAAHLVTRWERARPGRLLIGYLLLRQSSAALGLTSLGGHAPMVRPLLAPMTEAAAQRDGDLQDSDRERLRAMAAATDNVGLFFGEDLFLAFGAVLLMQSFYADHGIELSPLAIALWGIPTAVCAFLIHGYRLYRLDQRLRSAP